MILRRRSLLPLASLFILSVCAAPAQTATASLGGVVEDASGAVIGDAKIVLRNVQTNVEKTTTSNSSGSYDILDILPGDYTLEASKNGFRSTKIDQFTLAVDQTANVNISLSVGSVTESVAVQGSVGQLESSTAELGTVIQEKQVVDLPLNGRNFTQLLLLSPGASPTNVGQSSSGFTTSGIGTFAYPAMNGQSNRSNIYLLDGSYNLGLLGTPVLNPIIDTIAELKVQSHSDLPQFGQGVGGVVSVVTKSGTNTFHGSAWEFLRNNDLDARNYFVPTVTPFHQSQFGAAGGGSILKNKAFFYGGYQGFHLSKPSNTLYGVPTPANLTGDLSNTSAQIYDPFSTRPDPAHPGQYLRDPFPGNIIPQSRLV